MAVIETWVDQDLKAAVKVRHLDGVVFDADSAGNLVGVRVYSDGSPVTLSGSCTGYCILANGTSVPVVGTVSGNRAYIVLPSTAYTVPGPICIILKLIQGTSIITLAAITSIVYGLGGSVTEPSQATIDAWTAQITAAIAVLEGTSVRYDAAQSLTSTQKTQARDNIGAKATLTLISGNNYRLTI